MGVDASAAAGEDVVVVGGADGPAVAGGDFGTGGTVVFRHVERSWAKFLCRVFGEGGGSVGMIRCLIVCDNWYLCKHDRWMMGPGGMKVVIRTEIMG